jgi:hypothetical protein
MQAELSNFMALVLLVQATGWCCHRSCDSLHSPHCEDLQTAGIAGCGHRDSMTDTNQPPASPGKCPECFGCCTYVQPEKTQLDNVELGIPFDLSAVALEIRMVLACRWQLGADALQSRPPLRLHLLHQFLLI